MDTLCIKCKGKGLCGRPCKILAQFKSHAPKPKLHFSGRSSPELFVGRIGYPYINSGILAPSENDNLANFSSAEEWASHNFSIANVLRLRGQLIYGRAKTHIKGNEGPAGSSHHGDKIKQITQELALSSKPISTEIFLKKKPTFQFTIDSVFQPMTNPAPISRAILEENPRVSKKVDYLVNDTDAKSVTALTELYKANTKIDHLQKLLSIGLLGRKAARRMVPTRWSITATDDTLSKEQLKSIRYFSHLSQITLYQGSYLGNHIHALLLPGSFSFEAIESWLPNQSFSENRIEFTQDHETFFGRKHYAYNVQGGYYAMRLPLTEHLMKIKRQATVLIFREISEEYYAPLGVGIVREATKNAFKNPPQHFDTKEEVLQYIQTKIETPMEAIKEKSWLLNNYGKQKTLFDF